MAIEIRLNYQLSLSFLLNILYFLNRYYIIYNLTCAIDSIINCFSKIFDVLGSNTRLILKKLLYIP